MEKEEQFRKEYTQAFVQYRENTGDEWFPKNKIDYIPDIDGSKNFQDVLNEFSESSGEYINHRQNYEIASDFFYIVNHKTKEALRIRGLGTIRKPFKQHRFSTIKRSFDFIELLAIDREQNMFLEISPYTYTRRIIELLNKKLNINIEVGLYGYKFNPETVSGKWIHYREA